MRRSVRIYMTAVELESVARVLRKLEQTDKERLRIVADVYDQGDNLVGAIEKADVGNYVFFPNEDRSQRFPAA